MPEDMEPEAETVDPSHELDMVPIFSATGTAAEMEAIAIHAILEANEIPSMLVGNSTIPVLEFQVHVPRARKAEAERAIADAQAAGPSAADEAEQTSEGPV